MQGSFSGFVANGGDLSATGDFIPKEGMQNRWEVGREKRGNVHVASTRCGLFTTEPPLDGGVKGKAKGASEVVGLRGIMATMNEKKDEEEEDNFTTFTVKSSVPLLVHNANPIPTVAKGNKNEQRMRWEKKILFASPLVGLFFFLLTVVPPSLERTQKKLDLYLSPALCFLSLSENRVKRKKRLVFGGVVMGLSWER
ncbi:hypothetical protein BHE74_00008160 [Ensete ventricosum]|nr:hypothetical protein GW17_00003025 [Ensete ventricosum]RWW83337.1 hypothetical protein BHE74_00008160 [Ensete ventricosum]RZR89837.1 hypothetical protein BHM03_00017631 [Ensete ventricosum]